MSVQVETIGYKFRVTQGASVFDVISTTQLGMTKSNEIIRAFFDNFKVLKTERVALKPEEDVANDGKSSGDTGNVGSTYNQTDKVGEVPIVRPARKQREAMKNMWGNLRDSLSEEFTIAEYTKALRDAGYEYTQGSWEAVPGQQLKKLCKIGKIEKVEGSKPVQYRKIKVPHSFRSDQKVDNTIKSLKEGKKVIMGAIE